MNAKHFLATFAAALAIALTGCGGGGINQAVVLADSYRHAVNTGSWATVCDMLHPEIRAIAGGLHATYRLQQGDPYGAKIVEMHNDTNPGSECPQGMDGMSGTIDFTMPEEITDMKIRDGTTFIYTPTGHWAWDQDGKIVDAPWVPKLFAGPNASPQQ